MMSINEMDENFPQKTRGPAGQREGCTHIDEGGAKCTEPMYREDLCKKHHDQKKLNQHTGVSVLIQAINVEGHAPQSSSTTMRCEGGDVGAVNVDPEINLEIEKPRSTAKRAPKICKTSACNQRVVLKSFCSTHMHDSVEEGLVADYLEKRKARYSCKYRDCKKASNLKSLCLLHAREVLEPDVVAEFLRKSRDGAKQCKYTLCTKRSIVKGYCQKHAREVLGNEVMTKHKESRACCHSPGCTKVIVLQGFCTLHAREAVSKGEIKESVWEKHEERVRGTRNRTRQNKIASKGDVIGGTGTES